MFGLQLEKEAKNKIAFLEVRLNLWIDSFDAQELNRVGSSSSSALFTVWY